MAATYERLTHVRRASVRIEQRLTGNEVRYRCDVCAVGSKAAVRVVRAVEDLTNFGGVLPKRRTNRAGDPAYHCPRLKGDCLQRLSGRRRGALIRVLERKINQRIRAKAVR
jgi:hypothetical protein